MSVMKESDYDMIPTSNASTRPMKLPESCGWQRLGVALSVIWAGVIAAAAIFESILPSVHSWLNASLVGPDDPLGLFPRIVWSRVAASLLVPIALLWLLGATCAWVRNGFEKFVTAPYIKGERLADTLALIQVLALDENPHRSEEKLQAELQGEPRSAKAWASLAGEHPEFFRVRAEAEHPVSLIARHVLPKDVQGDRTLPSDYTAKLMQLAVELHDRQLRRVQAWQAFIPILVAVVAGAVSLVGIALKG
jgi:hypothetical protein